MKIFVTGTRGIPDIPGGVEKHCQELYPRIAAKGHQVWVSNRTPYLVEHIRHWAGVDLIPTYAPRIKSFEAIIHTFLSIIKAVFYRPDVLHIHAIGPSLLTPVARLLGHKTVVTNHGPDYERQKWGRLAKRMLMLGEKQGGKWANEVIAISPVITEIIKQRCQRKAHLIFNGVNMPILSSNTDYLQKMNIKPGWYILTVARFVPEKGLHDLIKVFKAMDTEIQLVIAGDADHETEYSRRLKAEAAEEPRIILTGYITGDNLSQVYSHAGLFILPSYHEGLPISLLEAICYGLTVLASDIAANQQICLPARCYYRLGDFKDLEKKICSLLESPFSQVELIHLQKNIYKKYSWDEIASHTIAVYSQAQK